MNEKREKIRQLALIGPTASGKTALSIEIAKRIDGYILSLDSLAIYKEMDIVSAKPTLKERDGVEHFGIDYLYPDEEFDVTTFIDLYHTVYAQCLQEKKNLIIVGGTSFYLKMLIDGISQLPPISQKSRERTNEYLKNLKESYKWLKGLDPTYISNIAPTDRYRIEKALQLYIETSLTPTEYFREFPPKPTITAPLPIYQIDIDRVKLRERIALRTNLMIESGLIDEICRLEKKYSRKPNAMKAIGVKETLAYLDGIYSKEILIEKIITNTAKLAKRQTTFNNSQFKDVKRGSIEELREIIR